VSERVTVEHTPDGRLVAVKRSRHPRNDARLRHEAEVLERARHPGVVELVHLEERGEDTALLTLAVAEGSLERRPRPSVPRVAALAASLASTLADLHAMGVVHGRIEASHVLVGRDGRPILCGFSEAATDSTSASSPAADDLPTPPDDLAGLGRLVLALLSADTEIEPIPELRRRLFARARHPGWTGYQQRALLTLADQASADEPSHRPTARAFAAALSAAFPDALLHDEPTTSRRLDLRVEPEAGPEPAEELEQEAPADGPEVDPHTARPATPPAGRRAPRVAIAGGAALVGVLGLATLALGASSVRGGARPQLVAEEASDRAVVADQPPTTAGDPPPTPSPSSTTSTTATPASTSADPASGNDGAQGCPTADGPVADLDGDGCAGAISVEGTVVTTDAGRFQVGEDGDEVVLGDWDCDGSSTPALLRPDTGDVFVFERWASQEDEVSTTAVQQVDGATDLRVDRTGGCDRLVVTAAGGEVEVDVDGGA